MKENLSERLCKECGVEPKYWCSYHSCICPIQDIGKFNPKCPKQAVTKECDARSKKPRYPDFENNNNNFVKLINIIFLCGINQKYDYQLATLSFEEDYYYCSDDNSNTFQKRYIEVLLCVLSKNYDSWDNKFQKIIKQAIKNTEWEY